MRERVCMQRRGQFVTHERRRSAARRWRRRPLLRGAAAAVGPPTVRLAGGGGLMVAHGKIAYLTLPFRALPAVRIYRWRASGRAGVSKVARR